MFLGFSKSRVFDTLLKKANYTGINQLFYPANETQTNRFANHLLKGFVYNFGLLAMSIRECLILDEKERCMDAEWITQAGLQANMAYTIQRRIHYYCSIERLNVSFSFASIESVGEMIDKTLLDITFVDTLSETHQERRYQLMQEEKFKTQIGR